MTTTSKLTPREIEAIYDAAQARYAIGSDDDIEFDDLEHYLNDTPIASRFSAGPEGMWIQAWIWIPNY